MTVFKPLDMIFALPETILLGTALSLLILGLFRGEQGFQRIMVISKVALAAVFTMICAMPKEKVVIFEGDFIQDPFSILIKALVVACAFVVLLMSRTSLALEGINRYEYPVLLLFAVVGMMIMVSANSFLSLFVGLELQSLSLYVLTAFRRDNAKASEAGVKYFVLGALSTGLLLYGCSLIYGYTGTINFEGLANILNGKEGASLPILFGVVFLISGLAFKISAVPFHMWAPDVYEGTPTSVTVFIATASKVAAFALVTRVLLLPFPTLEPWWRQILAIIAVASMIWGAFAALTQRKIKRFLAYSSIGNMGYTLIGIVVATEEGLSASLVYLIIYLIMTAGVFTCLLTMTRRGQELDTIEDLKGLVRLCPGTASTLSFLLFSMASIPPLAGFLGKLYIFKAAVAANFTILAIIGVVASVVAAAYYLWVIKVILIDEPDLKRWEAHYPSCQRDPSMTLILLGVVFGLIWIFIIPGPLVQLANTAAASLFG